MASCDILVHTSASGSFLGPVSFSVQPTTGVTTPPSNMSEPCSVATKCRNLKAASRCVECANTPAVQPGPLKYWGLLGSTGGASNDLMFSRRRGGRCGD